MILTRLKLIGFKSFVEPTEFLIEPGLTGIVGPNGCGKSNLVEALRWVMGESSHKNLRAAEMDQVIFAGTAGRPARNTAEVILTIDNRARRAPAAFNGDDTIEVSRKIERDQGSTYRINGREVRARDVQLLFADASTGARSPAMVRQGQIAELIAAKPQARRRVLEEAAGISGLHTRRHEAELRLKGAEQNLDRLEDVLAQIESQLEALKRQSRQAARYRALSSEIRQAEALLFHLDFEEAGREVVAAEKRLDADVRLVGERTRAQAEAARLGAVAQVELTPLREAEAVAAATVQRLTIAREQLASEERRAAERLVELDRRIAQTNADVNREKALIADGGAMIERMAAEQTALSTQNSAATAGKIDAAARVSGTETALAGAEAAMGETQAALAELQARRGQVDRTVRDGLARIEKLDRQLAEIERERAAVAAGAADPAVIEAMRADRDATVAAVAAAEARALEAEADHLHRRDAETQTRPPLEEAERRAARLETEARTLAKLVSPPTDAAYPAVLERLRVKKGYELALGAALGDDLDLPDDPRALAHWGGAAIQPQDPALPPGIEPLGRFVDAPPSLARRLAQIGIVARDQGAALQPRLAPGQRLVSLKGDLWRWDGLTTAADAPTPAARRLVERNRLTDLEAEAAAARAAVLPLRQAAEAARIAAREAGDAERAAREAWRGATRLAEAARDRLAATERQTAQTATRLSALEEARIRLAASRAEAEAVLRSAEEELARLPDDATLQTTLTGQRLEVAQRRAELAEARAAMQTLAREIELRDGRLTAIAAEIETWRRRSTEGQAQIDTLLTRLSDLKSERATLDEAPAAFAARRRALNGEIETALARRQEAAYALAAAETRQRAADQAARAAIEALGAAREEQARSEERLEASRLRWTELRRAINEALSVEPNGLLRIAGLAPGAALPPRRSIERDLDTARGERERLGAVNLRAEDEQREVQAQLDGLVRERDDLIEAIKRLRHAIAGLNKEGRERLLAAFDVVNGHFQTLFSTLFGGGSAELQLTESDDPLEAGLDILAKPPGKKPQTLSLLSGGEQALTATALIFAVFLTNPAPICVLDEVDAPLDDANVDRYCTLLDAMTQRTATRFAVVTHNPITMARMNRLFGVTMAERGVSQLVSVDLSEAEQLAEAA